MIIKILKYSFSDLIRSTWSYVYFAFYLLLSFVLLFLNGSLSKAIITLMNITVVLTPMIGIIFGTMYFYHSREFTELLLAQPIKRKTIFIGQYLGLAISLSISFVLGLGIPFGIYGIVKSSQIWDFSTLIISGIFLTFIFSSLSFYIGLINTDRIKGFGYAILIWLFFAVIYDGILLILLIVFDDYPIDKFTLVSSFFNPIDLSRIMILLKLDISALLGYTGALFQQFFGTEKGLIIAFSILTLWIIGPLIWIVMKSSKKDF